MAGSGAPSGSSTGSSRSSRSTGPGEPSRSPGAVHRRIVEAGRLGRVDDALALIHPDVLDHRGGTAGDHRGLEAWRDKWAHMYDGLTDVSATVEQNVESGDLSVNRYTLRGAEEASGRRYEVAGIDMIRVRDGLLVEHWALMDVVAMRHQLGAPARA